MFKFLLPHDLRLLSRTSHHITLTKLSTLYTLLLSFSSKLVRHMSTYVIPLIPFDMDRSMFCSSFRSLQLAQCMFQALPTNLHVSVALVNIVAINYAIPHRIDPQTVPSTIAERAANMTLIIIKLIVLLLLSYYRYSTEYDRQLETAHPSRTYRKSASS